MPKYEKQTKISGKILPRRADVAEREKGLLRVVRRYGDRVIVTLRHPGGFGGLKVEKPISAAIGLANVVERRSSTNPLDLGVSSVRKAVAQAETVSGDSTSEAPR
jgi:hypothetical protein